MLEFEEKIVKFLNGFAWAPLDFLSWIISDILFLTVLWVIGIAISVKTDFIRGVMLAVGLAAAFIIHYTVSEGIIKYGARKLSLKRTRPYLAFPREIRPIGRNFSDSSFPSSHVASVTGGLIVLSSIFPSIWLGSLIFLMLLSLSRLHNGMHYPTDILAGIVLGTGYGFASLAILKLLF